MNMVPSSCIYCSAAILVNLQEFSQMDANICAACFPVRAPFSSRYLPAKAAPQVTSSKRDATEFEQELEDILSNDGLDFFDMPDWVFEEQAAPKCECGSATMQWTSHSAWCPIYTDPMLPKGSDNERKGDYE